MNMQYLFDQLGIKDDRTRILAVVASPQVFFDRCRTEDEAMNVAKAFVCNTFIKMITLPNLHLECLSLCYRNIEYSMFHNSHKARDVLYAMRDQKYLDELIKWANTVVATVLHAHIEFTVANNNYLTAETGWPVFATCKEYEEYNEKAKI